MELIIRKTIGKQIYSFVCQGRNLHDCLMEAEKLSFPDVLRCGLCDSDSLFLTAYVTKDDGYKYAKIKCAHCRGDLTFGQKKQDPDTFYLRKTEAGKLEWKKHVEKQEEQDGKGRK